MKKLFYPVVLCLGMCTGFAQASEVKSYPDKQRQNSAEVLVDEDFSLFTAGTEDNPDSKELSDYYYSEMDSYLKAPGWTGAGIFQAGGVCAVKVTEDPYYGMTFDGYLNTPGGDYSGVLEYTFRVKVIGDKEATMQVIVTDGISKYAEKLEKIGNQWTNLSGELKAEPSGICYIQFSLSEEGAEFLIDDIRVVRTKAILAVVEPEQPTDVGRNSFTAHWKEHSQADSYLLSVYSKRTVSPAGGTMDGQSSETVLDYVLENYSVNENFYEVSGLDENTDYFYSVIAKKGDLLSDVSREVAVIGLIPTVSEAPTEIMKNSFVANWQRTPKADGYIISNYQTYESDADEAYVLLKEDFSLVDVDATPENPEEFPSKTTVSLDPYTAAAGWLFSGALRLANGMVGGYGWQATVQTPVLTLNNGGGEYEVSLRAWCEKGKDLIVQADEEVKTVTFDETGFKLLNFTMKNGQEKDHLRFATTAGNIYFIDELEIKQNLKKGDKVTSLNCNLLVEKGDETSCKVADLDCEKYTYYYIVGAYRHINGNVIYSEDSAPQNVLYDPTYLNKTVERGEGVWVENNTIRIVCDRYADLNVYNASGMLVAARRHVTGSIGINDLASGVYIVRIDRKCYKVVVGL